MGKQGTVRKAVLDPKDWEDIVTYLVQTPVRFEDAEKVFAIKKIIGRVLWADLKLDEQAKEESREE